jgi:hypothetical protein
MHSKWFPLVRGVGGGFLIALINGISLPILFELFVMVLDIIRTGHWYGPMAIMELWFILFVFGFGCSLLPNIVANSILSLFSPLLHTMQLNWLRICVGVVVGIIVTIFYVALLSYFEIVSIRETALWAAFILIEEICIYIWIAHRWGR